MEFSSVMYFNPSDSQEQRWNKFNDWIDRNHNSAVQDKAVPGVEETRAFLQKLG